MPEKLFLVCQDCGESFEADGWGIQALVDHLCEKDDEMTPLYMLVPESEAF